ncbi:MAG: hypothetical protein Kow0069_16420 [Promethearchaeota archaeon]
MSVNSSEPVASEVECDARWVEGVTSAVERVFLGQLRHEGTFNELHAVKRPWWRFWERRERPRAEPVGAWGWNTWCGVHALPYLVNYDIRQTIRNTVDVALSRPEPGTGLLPHAVLHEGGAFASRVEYRCYGGAHGEGYNLDNVLCWAKLAMEFFLATGDAEWFAPRFPVVARCLDAVLTQFLGKYNPALAWAGVEGDWTECTDWEGDNANVSVNLARALELAVECGRLLLDLDLAGGHADGVPSYLDYAATREELIRSFNAPVRDGGFWHEGGGGGGRVGWFVHGNDGKGGQVHGDRYFESTCNYFALLWGVATPEHERLVWNYCDAHRTPLELPLPVLTNHLPRTGARREPYGRTVTNGDVWVALGGHAAAARLQAGHLVEGTEMYRAIVDHEAREGTLHNCVYQDGSVNADWDPEIGNYGGLFAPLVLGVLGLRPRAAGLEFNLAPLVGATRLDVDVHFSGRRYHLRARWDPAWSPGRREASSGRAPLPPVRGDLSLGGESAAFDRPRFLLSRGGELALTQT